MLWQDTEQSITDAGRRTEANLPADFTDTFDAAWSNSWLFSQSVAGMNARNAVLADHLAEVSRKTGKPVDLYPEYEDQPWSEQANRALQRLRDQGVDAPSLSDDELERRAVARSRAAHGDYEAMGDRERTWGGTAGNVLGNLAGAATDPVNIVALPVAPAEGLGILATAARWAAIGGVSQGIIEATGGPYREEVQPGYVASGAPVTNVIEGAVGAGFLGGATRALGNAWTRLKTGEWPRSVRDAGNLAESEANILDTNRFPGVEGEVAHRSALQDSIDRLISGDNGEPAGLTESVLASYDKRLEPALDSLADVRGARNAVQMEKAAQEAQVAPELPFAGSIAEGQEVAAIAKLGGHIEDIARSVGAEIDPAEARALADKLSRLPLNEATAALDEFMLRPRTLPDTLPSVSAIAKERRALVKATPEPVSPELAAQVAPEAVEKLRAEPELDETILRDLDRLRAEKGDVEIPMGETVNAAGDRVVHSRKVDDVLAEADERLAAAKEIEACAGPQEAAE